MVQNRGAIKEKESLPHQKGTRSLEFRGRNRGQEREKQTPTPGKDNQVIISRSRVKKERGKEVKTGSQEGFRLPTRALPQLQGYFGLQSLDLSPYPGYCRGLKGQRGLGKGVYRVKW